MGQLENDYILNKFDSSVSCVYNFPFDPGSNWMHKSKCEMEDKRLIFPHKNVWHMFYLFYYT